MSSWSHKLSSKNFVSSVMCTDLCYLAVPCVLLPVAVSSLAVMLTITFLSTPPLVSESTTQRSRVAFIVLLPSTTINCLGSIVTVATENAEFYSIYTKICSVMLLILTVIILNRDLCTFYCKCDGISCCFTQYNRYCLICFNDSVIDNGHLNAAYID